MSGAAEVTAIDRDGRVELAKARSPSPPARKSGKHMVTVSPRLQLVEHFERGEPRDRTLGKLSPEQATIPTFCFGRLGMLAPRGASRPGRRHVRDPLGNDACELPASRVDSAMPSGFSSLCCRRRRAPHFTCDRSSAVPRPGWPRI